MTATEFGVLVAVGPDGICDGALDFAATEALRRGTGVELIHVVHSLVVATASTDEVQSVDRALTRVARDVLTRAAERLQDRVPHTTEIVFGPIARTIAERGSAAQLIVLERRNPGAMERLMTMSISTGVAAHAHVPVVVVPPTWTIELGKELPVTVGIDRPLDAKAETTVALDYARATGRPLVVMHAAWIAEPYQDLIFGGYSRSAWTDDATRALELALSGVAEAEDDVTYDVRWVRPVEALVLAAERSSVLVLSRRDPRHAHGAHLGPIVRGALHHAQCPVMVVDRAVAGDDGS